MTTRQSDETADLATVIETFERENPEVVREIDLLGMEVDQYVQILVASAPQTTTSNSTTPIP